jgi:nucleotide-binding universal stress UspA family protein
MERILVGVDGSAPSLKAVDFAADLAGKYNAELILLTVVPHPSPELDAAVEEYARLEHVPVREAERSLTTADGALDGALETRVRRASRGSRPSRRSATLPMQSLQQPATDRPI